MNDMPFSRKLKVGVCESGPEMEPGSLAWKDLAEEVREAKLDVFLINEMPFGPWVSAGEVYDPNIWSRSVELHDQGVLLLGQLGAKLVMGSRPCERGGRRVNEAYLWTPDGGYQGVHSKQYFPDEEGYYEARWFQVGDRHFRVVEAGDLRVGFLICTEVMFNEHARWYGRAGAHIIAVPRAVGKASHARWLVAMKMAAVVSGCYVLTSNRSGKDSRGQKFGGMGWIVDPHGDLVAQTSNATTVVTSSIDPSFVTQTQTEYPCYVAVPGETK